MQKVCSVARDFAVPLITLLGLGAALGDQNPPPHSSTVVRAEAAQPADTPILLTVTVTNDGDEPISYSTNFGRYPPGSWFSITITNAKGRTKKVELSNDDGVPGSGGREEIEPAGSVTAPVMMDALPVGSYTIRVWNSKSASFTVKDDPELARKWDDDLLAKIRAGDRFANHVANMYLRGKHARPSFIEGILGILSSDKELVAERAAYTLNRAPELPAKARVVIIQALRKQLASAQERGFTQTSHLTPLAGLAARVGTDEALEAVLTLAHTQETRGIGLWALGDFKQEKALKELRLFLKDGDETLRFRAAQRLSERKDSQAIEVLLVVAHDPKSRWRMYSFDALLKYRDDPRVEAAIKSGLDDPDSNVRDSAEFALRTLRSAKKP
jgi:HEAT repeat protein